MKLKNILLAGATACGMTACQSTGNLTTEMLGGNDGQEWQVMKIGQKKVTPSDETPFLCFKSDGLLWGFNGCNRLTGSYKLKANGKIDLSKVGCTMMLCPEDTYETIFMSELRKVKQANDYAHERGVVVEAELGQLAGIEDDVNVSEEDAKYTDPDQAKEFVERTGCDSLAIAIGTSHGAYKFKGEARLRMDILKQVKEKIPNTPIVLHGASTVIPELVETCNSYGGDIPGAKGVPDEILHEASLSGVSKINVDTDLRLAFTGEIRKSLAENPSAFDPRKYLTPAREKITEVVEHKIKDVFGSSNKE